MEVAAEHDVRFELFYGFFYCFVSFDELTEFFHLCSGGVDVGYHDLFLEVADAFKSFFEKVIGFFVVDLVDAAVNCRTAEDAYVFVAD